MKGYNLGKVFLGVLAIFLCFSFAEAVTVDLTSPSNGKWTNETRPSLGFEVGNLSNETVSCDLVIDGNISGTKGSINSTSSYSITPSSDLSEEKHTWNVECNNTSANSRTLYIGNAGLVIKEIEIDPEDPEVKEDVEITITVENKMDQELEDVKINDLEIDGLDVDKEREEDDLKDGEEEEYNFDITIPCDADENSYDIEVTVEGVGEDDDEDYEATDTNTLDIDRNTHDICILSKSFSPSSVECGDSTTFEVEMFNSGKRDEDDMYVVVSNNELGIEKKTENFDLDELEDTTESLVFNLPSETSTKAYPFTIEVYYDEGDEEISSVNSLDVSCIQPEYKADIILNPSSLELKAGEEGDISATLENTGDEETSYDLSISGASTWADYEVTPSSLTLDTGESSGLSIKIVPKEGVSGTKTASLEADFEGNTRTKTFTVDIKETEEAEVVSEGEGEETEEEETYLKENKEFAIGAAVIGVVVLLLVGYVVSKNS